MCACHSHVVTRPDGIDPSWLDRGLSKSYANISLTTPGEGRENRGGREQGLEKRRVNMLSPSVRKLPSTTLETHKPNNIRLVRKPVAVLTQFMIFSSLSGFNEITTL